MKKVLIVDDSTSFSLQLEQILADSGEFQVVGQGRNGMDAISLEQSLQPDIICMDINMPLMDGLTALRTLTALNSDIKVVMTSSLGSAGNKFAEALRLGARQVISKPFEHENVLRTLREL